MNDPLSLIDWIRRQAVRYNENKEKQFKNVVKTCHTHENMKDRMNKRERKTEIKRERMIERQGRVKGSVNKEVDSLIPALDRALAYVAFFISSSLLQYSDREVVKEKSGYN